ncbi:hypothetical protein FQZ97_1041760 [compost metagenome]
MLHRIDVDVIEVPLVIEVIADQVFPIAALPDTAFISFTLGIRAWLNVRQPFGEGELDCLPTIRIGPVAGRQSPEAVHVLGQHDPGIDMEGVTVFDHADYGT